MVVLIVDDDPLIAELLTSLVEGLYRDADVVVAETRAEAVSLWQERSPELMILDWQLPDGSGVDALRDMRARGASMPVIMVTRRSDRKSVLAAAKYGLAGFISKPFNVETVLERLRAVLPPESSERDSNADGGVAATFVGALESGIKNGVQLSSTLDISQVLEMREGMDNLTVAQVERAWRPHATLQTRLIDLANSAAFRSDKNPVNALSDALRVLGMPVAMDVALVMSLSDLSELKTPFLRKRATRLDRRSLTLATTAVLLARDAGIDDAGCFAAGMLHAIGEFAVISLAQQWMNRGHELDEISFEQALTTHSARLAGALKARWHFTVELKQMIGAVYGSISGSDAIRLLLMRAAALVVDGEHESDECRRLLRRLKLEVPASLLEALDD
jgi:DNA-binding response OmpR family regulator